MNQITWVSPWGAAKSGGRPGSQPPLHKSQQPVGFTRSPQNLLQCSRRGVRACECLHVSIVGGGWVCKGAREWTVWAACVCA